MNLNTIECVDVLDYLRSLPDNLVDCVVTSPPFLGLRSYLPDEHKDKSLEIGLEDTPQAFVARLVEVFREVRRVLKPTGTCWLELGDSYNNFRTSGYPGQSVHNGEQRGKDANKQRGHIGFKEKDLMMMPARVAIALQEDGWYLRSEIVWHKPNPMPESVTDRPTKAHEMVYLLTKSATYFYDADAIREPHTEPWRSTGKLEKHGTKDIDAGANNGFGLAGVTPRLYNPEGRNARSVWTIPTQATPFAHFATYPQELVRRCVLAGCPAQTCSVCGAPYERDIDRTANYEKRQDRGQPGYKPPMVDSSGWKPATVVDRGWFPSCNCNSRSQPGVVLDPFMGSGTTALSARSLGRSFLGCDLNEKYVAIANERLRMPFEQHYSQKDDGLDGLPLFDLMKGDG